MNCVLHNLIGLIWIKDNVEEAKTSFDLMFSREHLKWRIFRKNQNTDK